MIESTINAETTVMDGSFYQPLESTRLTRTTANWSPNDSSLRATKSIPCLTKPEQNLYKLYAQSFADSELTEDWPSWLEAMKINCQKTCSEAELCFSINFRSTQKSQTNQSLKSLENELHCWLLWHFARDALSQTFEDFPEIIPGSSDRLIVEANFSRDRELRMAKAVQIWLQTIKSTENYQNELKMSMAKLQKKRFYWEKTFHHLRQPYKSDLSNTFVTCLDFDAANREKRQLYDTDQTEEHDLLQTVYLLLRIGEQTKAKNLCRSTGYHWLAAIICSSELYHDENYYCSEGFDSVFPVDGNRKRIEWAEKMFELCMDVRLSVYERAIYGFLCGRIEALLGICKSYDDFLWASVSCFIEQKIDSILRSVHRDSSVEMSEENRRTGRNLSFTAIFDLLQSFSGELSVESSTPFRRIQKLIILDEHETLFELLPKFVSEQPSTSLIRFATHLGLFLFKQNTSNRFSEKNFIEIVSNYVQHLIDFGFKEIVCFYISKLPDEYRSRLMAKFIDNLNTQQEKEFYLNQGFTFKIDIDQSLLILAANQQTDQLFDRPSSTDFITNNDRNLNEHDRKQLEALKLLTSFISTQTLDALRFANRLCRYFLHELKYDGIREALSYFPFDIDIYSIEANNREQSVDDLREFKSFAAFIVAIESIERWSEFHQKGTRSEINGTNEIQSKSYLPVVIKSCYAVFEFSQGWLVDITTVHKTLADSQQRENEMSIVRQKAIPILVSHLLRIFDLLKEDQEIFRLIVLLSDHREQKLYTLFQKESISSILSLVELAAERSLDRLPSNTIDENIRYL